MECTLAVAGKDKTRLVPVYCIMDMREGAFMCKFSLKPKNNLEKLRITKKNFETIRRAQKNKSGLKDIKKRYETN